MRRLPVAEASSVTEEASPPLEGLELQRQVQAAYARIGEHVRRTPLQASPSLSQVSEGEVFLKLENFQVTGSFKVRGSMNKILSLTPEQRAAGVVTASSGNHGAGVAYSVQRHGGRAVIFVPEGASRSKMEAIRGLGAEVRVHGHDSVITETYAREWAQEAGGVYVSPYNDPLVVAGQGTVGLELAQQLPDLDSVIIALGGGGLTSGIAGYLKALRPEIDVVAASPANAPVMHESVHAGRILPVESLPTLSDGTAGGVEEGSITFPLCQDHVDHFVLATEEEIRGAMRWIIGKHHMLVEGAAGVAVAALLKEPQRYAGRKVVVLLCGANVGMETLAEVVS